MDLSSVVDIISAPSHSLVSTVNPIASISQREDARLIIHSATSKHNFQLNGTGDGPIKSIVNKQYNSPVGIYSEETIAETLSAQAEVLAGGVLG
jgi:hypothetical protein